MTQELEEINESDRILNEALRAFELNVSGKSNKEIADELGVSVRTVTNRLSLARKAINEHLLLEGKSHFADLWAKYNWMFTEAQSEWKSSRNPAFMLAMNQILKSMREMLALDRTDKDDKPGKDDAVIMMTDETEYKDKEKAFEEEMSNNNMILDESRGDEIDG